MTDTSKITPDELKSLQTTPLVLLFISVRLVINTTYRMIYPFLRIFANGLGISLQTAALPLTGRSLVAAFGPLFAPLIDRHGRKRGMLLGLTMFTIGTGLVALWPTFPTFFFGLVLANLGNQIFLPAMQAYLGDRIPFSRRGRILALTELAWSLSFLSLLPVSFLISRQGWTAPFGVLAGLGLAATLLLAWTMPSDHRPTDAPQTSIFWHSLRTVFISLPARTALLFSLSIALANELVNSMFGVWLTDNFQLQITTLGLSAVVIGAAELSGEAAAAVLVDQVGKRRAVRAGVIFTGLAALALPWLGQNLWGALAGLFLFYIGFEFTLVSYIPIMTEVLPEARATVMAANLAASSLGRALGALAGLMLYSASFRANGMVAVGINILALGLLTRIRVKE